MAIDFPNSPTTGQAFTSGTTTWIYDGTKWNIDSTTVAFAPIGTIIAYGGTTNPNGWLDANGDSLSRSTYQHLYDTIGTAFGDGAVPGTTFALPNFVATEGKYIIRAFDAEPIIVSDSLIGVPVGTLQLFAAAPVASGWLRANGSAISRTSYSDLFTVIGTTYGSGDGSTTFNLPNITASGTGSPEYYIKAVFSGDVEPSTVSHAASHTEGGSDVITVTGNQIANYQSFRNVIINGGFDVWQRGTSFTAASLTSPYYTVDRWITVRGGLASGATWSRQTSDLTGFNYFMRCQRDSGNTGTANIHASTSFETVNIKRLQGKQLTLSFWAKAGANYSATSNALKVQIAVGTGTDFNYLITGFTSSSLILDSSITLTTSWQRFTLTTSSALLTTQNQLAVNIFSSPTGTAGAADYYDITGVQLEAGSVATPFEFEPYETTLRKCMRYYQRSSAFSGYSHNAFLFHQRSSGAYYATLPSKVEFRTLPTVTTYGYYGTINTVSSGVGGAPEYAFGPFVGLTVGAGISGLSGLSIANWEANAEL